jgi:pheromone alpha factor receptor
LNVLLISGTPVSISVEQVDGLLRQLQVYMSLFASQASAAMLTAIVLLACSQPEKRRTRLFLVNLTSLLALFLHCVLECCYAQSSWTSLGKQLSASYKDVSRGAIGLSIVTTLSVLPIIVLSLLSLGLQLRAVMPGETRIRQAILSFVATISVVAAILWVTASALTIRSTILLSQGQTAHPLELRVNRAASLTYGAAVGAASLVFIWNLWQIAKTDSQLCLRKSGALQTMFVMSTQTLVVPCALMIADVFTLQGYLAFMARSLVVLSLPFSSIWASAKADVCEARQRHEAAQARQTSLEGKIEVAVDEKTVSSFD